MYKHFTLWVDKNVNMLPLQFFRSKTNLHGKFSNQGGIQAIFFLQIKIDHSSLSKYLVKQFNYNKLYTPISISCNFKAVNKFWS